MAFRSQVLWVGGDPPDGFEQALVDRELTLKLAEAEQLDAEWPQSRAVIFSVPDATAALLDDVKKVLAANALIEGLRTYVVAPLEQIPNVSERLSSLPFFGRVILRPPAGMIKIAQECSGLQPGRERSAAVNLIGCQDCRAEDLALLRRAFNDCVEVRFTTLTGGRSAVVFQAYAGLRDSRAGPYPLPFFVKLDRYPKINKELDNYRDCTTLFIPFFARPNIDSDRCIRGAERGLIVGNFVEHSDSLAELVERGTAQTAINSLFEDALRGWRNQAYLSPQNNRTCPVARSLGGAIAQFSNGQRARADAYAREARALGATLSATQIGGLVDNLPSIQHHCALSHGDLHGENVRVRAGHAILIDFVGVQDGPLVADPASLETALVLRAVTQPADWIAAVTELYALGNLQVLPKPREPAAPLSSLWNVVRQIRRFGLAEQVSNNEYATAVAVYLLRHGLRGRDKGEPTHRRPTFIWLAERLAKALSEKTI